MRKYNGRDQGIRAGERDGYEGRVMDERYDSRDVVGARQNNARNANKGINIDTRQARPSEARAKTEG